MTGRARCSMLSPMPAHTADQPPALRVAVADDAALFRNGLCRLGTGCETCRKLSDTVRITGT